MSTPTLPEGNAGAIDPFGQLPLALEPHVPLGGHNEPIPMYRGPATLRSDETGEVELPDINIRLEWLPFPRVTFEAVRAVDGKVNHDLRFQIELPDGTLFADCSVTRVAFGSRTPGEFLGLVGSACHRHPVTARFTRVDFLLPNLRCYRGQTVSYASGEGSARSASAARNELAGGGWRVTVDAVLSCSEHHKRLRNESGYAVTHVGRLERADGAAFPLPDAEEVLEAVGWYVSFCEGSWTGPCLPAAVGDDGRRVWCRPLVGRCKPRQFRNSWLSVYSLAGLAGPFGGFFERWRYPDWREVVSHAIHWYVEANAQAGSIEGSIVLTQTAFELLSAAVLVDSEKWLSTDGYEKLLAADRIRLLFRWAEIPTAIPAELQELTRAAKERNWNDGPDAMTAVRNRLMHPTAKNRKQLGEKSVGFCFDAWQLGLWALELCLLRLFGYSGDYVNRITARGDWQGERVPWATAAPRP